MKKILTIGSVIVLAACAKAPESINDNKVFFAFDSAVISDAARNNLESQALYMKENPNVTVVLGGHCDERGSVDYNLALGALRAGNAAHVLMSEGIEPERIRTISYGKENPQYIGTGEAVWKMNRNVTTNVIR